MPMARTAAHSLAGIKGGAMAAGDQPVPFVENATGARNIISQFSCAWRGPHLSSTMFTGFFLTNSRHPKMGIMTGEAS